MRALPLFDTLELSFALILGSSGCLRPLGLDALVNVHAVLFEMLAHETSQHGVFCLFFLLELVERMLQLQPPIQQTAFHFDNYGLAVRLRLPVNNPAVLR